LEDAVEVKKEDGGANVKADEHQQVAKTEDKGKGAEEEEEVEARDDDKTQWDEEDPVIVEAKDDDKAKGDEEEQEDAEAKEEDFHVMHSDADIEEIDRTRSVSSTSSLCSSNNTDAFVDWARESQSDKRRFAVVIWVDHDGRNARKMKRIMEDQYQIVTFKLIQTRDSPWTVESIQSLPQKFYDHEPDGVSIYFIVSGYDRKIELADGVVDLDKWLAEFAKLDFVGIKCPVELNMDILHKQGEAKCKEPQLLKRSNILMHWNGGAEVVDGQKFFNAALDVQYKTNNYWRSEQALIALQRKKHGPVGGNYQDQTHTNCPLQGGVLVKNSEMAIPSKLSPGGYVVSAISACRKKLNITASQNNWTIQNVVALPRASTETFNKEGGWKYTGGSQGKPQYLVSFDEASQKFRIAVGFIHKKKEHYNGFVSFGLTDAEWAHCEKMTQVRPIAAEHREAKDLATFFKLEIPAKKKKKRG